MEEAKTVERMTFSHGVSLFARVAILCFFLLVGGLGAILGSPIAFFTSKKKLAYLVAIVGGLLWILGSYWMDGISIGQLEFRPHSALIIMGIPSLLVNLLRAALFGVLSVETARRIRKSITRG